MSVLAFLPHLNAGLNAASAVLLIVGYGLIRRRRVSGHRLCMIAAFGLSTLFLTGYLVYHYQVGSVRFGGTGSLRTLYLTILLTHSVLAAAVPFLAITALWRAWRGRFRQHARVARWTLPIWLYVSITGVIVYWMLYRLGP